MPDDDKLANLNSQIVLAVRETDKWATLASDFDLKLEQTSETSPDYDSVKTEHELAHKMAEGYQTELEGLFDLRDKLEAESKRIDDPNLGDEETITVDKEPEARWEDASFAQSLTGDESSQRIVADEELANAHERDLLAAQLDQNESMTAEIGPEHMADANALIQKMEDTHLAKDQSLTPDEQIQRLGESHMALYEAGLEAQDLTPPTPPPAPDEPNLNPAMKVKI